MRIKCFIIYKIVPELTRIVICYLTLNIKSSKTKIEICRKNVKHDLIAFLTRPQFLIFDEPYTYLDSSSIKLLNDLIKEHVKEGGSLIVVDNSSG